MYLHESSKIFLPKSLHTIIVFNYFSCILNLGHQCDVGKLNCSFGNIDMVWSHHFPSCQKMLEILIQFLGTWEKPLKIFLILWYFNKFLEDVMYLRSLQPYICPLYTRICFFLKISSPLLLLNSLTPVAAMYYKGL